MNTHTPTSPLLPQLPGLGQPLGLIGHLLRMIAQQHGDDVPSRETLNGFAAQEIEHLATAIERAAGDPEQLQQLVADIRALKPEPLPVTALRIGFWIGPSVTEHFEQIEGHYTVCAAQLVISEDADATCFPMPSSDTHWPNYVGFAVFRTFQRHQHYEPNEEEV